MQVGVGVHEGNYRRSAPPGQPEQVSGAPVFEIGDAVRRGGLFGFLRSGFQARAGKATPIRDPFVHPGTCDTIVVVQPVRASAVCPPVRTWMRAHRAELEGKRCALLLSNRGSDPGKVRTAFESGFGPVAVMDCIPERAAESDVTAALERFAGALGYGPRSKV